MSSTVTDIGEDAFYNCNSLREVVLNEGLVNVGKYAFNNCASLESITLPSSTVIEIGRSAFYRCSRLKNVVLNEGLQQIGDSAFSECTSLQRITIPSSVEEIGDYAFKDCRTLREVVCSEVLPNVESTVFNDCRELERITFPNLSTRLDAIIRAGQVDIQNNIQQYINQGDIEWRRGGMICIPVEVTRRRGGWGLAKQRFCQIVKWIKYYEIKEATTIFELAMWKAMIDQVGGIDSRDRSACRIEVPGPVKDAILQYLL